MGFCSPVCKILRRGKYFVLLLLSLSVLAWIATFSGETVKALQVSPATTRTFIKDRDNLGDKVNSPAPDHLKTPPSKLQCPQESPLLRKFRIKIASVNSPLIIHCKIRSFRFLVKLVNSVSTEGALKLSFESSLKLKDVEIGNKGVAEGEYEPPDCTARQSVAILIPHRNRERHLLYLLHHLHPFLQRQQLHYAIYVIQQVMLLII